MYLRPRQRRGVYSVASESHLPRVLRSLLKLGISLFVLYWIGSWILGALGFGNIIERDAATLVTENRGLISVSLQGEEEQTAENGMNIFPGDGISTGPTAHASMHFFDGTWVRMDEKTELLVEESARGKKESTIGMQLDQGRIWIRTPGKDAYTGTVLHTVSAGSLTYTLPVGTDAIVSPDTLIVYSADGQGIEVSGGGVSSFFIGEGQKWSLGESGPGPDPLSARTAIVVADLEIPFLLESRQSVQLQAGQTASRGSDDILAVTAPAQNFVLRGPTLRVQGSVNDAVAKVLVNGHEAIIDRTARSFTQEVAPPAGEDAFELQVKAVDATGNTLAIVNRTVNVERSAIETGGPTSPVITSPAATGETFTTQAQELIIRGTSPAGTAGIMVNDYKLQLFTPGKGTWSYLASQTLGNLKPGSNVYDVYALDANGAKSPPARITIFVGAQAPDQSSSAPAQNPQTLPNNTPLTPGVITVTGPTSGSTHAETGTGFLLEGRTSAQTSTMWVNDYRLQLYLPGKTTWNYIADVSYKNLVPGKNTYTVVARNENGEILDRFVYTVEYTPE